MSPVIMAGVNFQAQALEENFQERLQQLKEARKILRGRFSHKMPNCDTKEVISLAGGARLDGGARSHPTSRAPRLLRPRALVSAACAPDACVLWRCCFFVPHTPRFLSSRARGGGERPLTACRTIKPIPTNAAMEHYLSSSDILPIICSQVPAAERASTIAALSLCSRAMHKAAKRAAAAEIVGDTAFGWGGDRRRPDLDAVVTPRGSAPVDLGREYKGSRLYAWAGHVWSDSARAVGAEALEADAVVLVACDAAARRLLVTVTMDHRLLSTVEEFAFYRLGPWRVQAWRHTPRLAARGRAHRVCVAQLKGSAAAIKRRFSAVYETFAINERIAPPREAGNGRSSEEDEDERTAPHPPGTYEALAGLVVRIPRALATWDENVLSFRSCEKTKHWPVEDQSACLHYDTLDGGTLPAGLDNAIQMTALGALAHWKSVQFVWR